MQVLFLRHGQSHSNAAKAFALPDETGDRLTELGAEQARRAAAGLGGEGITQILASPLNRAQQTAAPIAEELGLPVETIEELREWREGDSPPDLLQQAARLQALLAARASGPVLAVSHGIFMRYFFMRCVLDEGAPAGGAEWIWQLGTVNCGLSRFDYVAERRPPDPAVRPWICLSWMERPWEC